MCAAALWKFATCWLLVGCLLPHVVAASAVVAKQPPHPAPGPPLAPKPPAPAPAPKPPHRSCASERSCILTASTEPICRYDGVQGCIKKYPSQCHLDIASCKAGKVITDARNLYCSMETFLCEEGYERWTIFFGYEKA